MEKKTIGKIVVSVLTIGVTATAAYYTFKAVKKHLANKKAAKQAAEEKTIETKKEEKTPVIE